MSEATVGSGQIGRTNRCVGFLLLANVASPVTGAPWLVQWRLTSPRASLRVAANVGGNHKVADSSLLLFEEVVESRVSVRVSNEAVVDAKRDHDFGCVPDFALATALAGTGACFRSTRIMITVGWVATHYGRSGEVGDGDGDGAGAGVGRNGVFEGVMRRVVGVRIRWELFGGPFCNT